MRVPHQASVPGRSIAFIVGFPDSLLSYLAVAEGKGRAYGIHIPRRDGGERDVEWTRRPPPRDSTNGT